MRENKLNNKNLPYDYLLFLFITQTICLLKDNAILHRHSHQSLRELLDFRELNYILTYTHDIFFQYYEEHTKY